jgi:hypothetical protein
MPAALKISKEYPAKENNFHMCPTLPYMTVNKQPPHPYSTYGASVYRSNL